MISKALGADTTVCVVGVGFVGLTLSVTLCDYDMKVPSMGKKYCG
jgi:UDP-N-acetyl-D-mannosaminuronate dehydrogenase